MEALKTVLALTAVGGLCSAHGGVYQGPSLPGPSTPGLIGPGPPGIAPTPAGPLSGIGASAGPDLSLWSLWWEYNKDPYLELKAHVRAGGVHTGSDGWFLGRGEQRLRESLGPNEVQIRGQIVPALLEALESETQNDLVTGCLVALAKIGDDGSAADGLRIQSALARFLTDGNQEIRETAAVALGILANPRSIPALAHLLWNTREGRSLVKKTEVDYRTRAFAAYGLGLIGARSESESDRLVIASVLRRAFEADDTRTRDLQVACLLAYSLVPLAPVAPADASASGRDARPGPESGRLGQIRYALELLRDEERHYLVRAYVPTVLARLCAGLPAELGGPAREELVEELVELIERSREVELVQSCVLALGAIGTNADLPLDREIRAALMAVPKQVSENQTRGFALIALARVGARPSADPAPASAEGRHDVVDFLLDQLLDGKATLRPWVALALGVLCHDLAEAGQAPPRHETLRRALRAALDDERSPADIGAYALACGLAQDGESAPLMLERLEQQMPDEARGQMAIGLALLDEREAIPLLREIVGQARYRPVLLRECAIALGILGDKDAVPQLARLLEDARGLAAQASIATALGFIGDERSVAPLVQLLESPLLTESARAFAAVALGNAADKELLPWNSKVGLDVNYRAAPATLSDPANGTGILDIL